MYALTTSGTTSLDRYERSLFLKRGKNNHDRNDVDTFQEAQRIHTKNTVIVNTPKQIRVFLYNLSTSGHGRWLICRERGYIYFLAVLEEGNLRLNKM